MLLIIIGFILIAIIDQLFLTATIYLLHCVYEKVTPFVFLHGF